MFDGRDVIYLYDGSFDGLLSAIFKSYYSHEIPLSIEEDKNIQGAMFCDYLVVRTDLKKAERVSEAICKKISYKVWENLYYTYLSDTEQKGRLCLDYVRAGFHFGKKVNSYMYIDCIAKVMDSVLRVKNEAHKFIEFVRFSEVDGGIYYSEIEPECHVLPLISSHFAKRFPAMPWMIHDTKRHLCMVYNGCECYLRETEGLPKINYTDDEKEYRKLWKNFYDTITIEERKNEKCRMGHMPKRYWKNLTEMQV